MASARVISQFTIDSTNKALVVDLGSGDVTATLDEGSYYWSLDDEDDDFIPDDPDDLLVAEDGEPDDNVTGDMEDSYWFTEEGGLTAEAYDWLAEQDSENGFC